MQIAILIFVLIIVGIAWGNQEKLDEVLEKLEKMMENDTSEG